VKGFLCEAVATRHATDITHYGGWRAYLAAGHDRAPLVQTLALAAVKEGNDPHNQEIGLCLLEDYGHTRAHDKDTLLLACAHHTAGHVKFGDPLEPYKRFAEAFGI